MGNGNHVIYIRTFCYSLIALSKREIKAILLTSLKILPNPTEANSAQAIRFNVKKMFEIGN
jgi:hypothetical protein